MDLEEPKLFLRMKLQSYRSNGMEWKSPEIYPYIHGQLIFNKGVSVIQHIKNNLVTKWYSNCWILIQE